MVKSAYSERLIQEIINHSVSLTWENAVLEWDIDDCVEDETCSRSCICGKNGLRFLFKIKNMKNDKTLDPIGSCCIKKFKVGRLDAKVSLQEELFKLLHATENKKYLTLTTDYFSKKLLKHLYDQGAFGSKKNVNDDYPINPLQDYEFLVKMFNKRDKSKISEKANKRINGIIGFSIKPFLQRMLNGKIIRRSIPTS